jgi:Ca2+-binding RTX toxin-like protein
MRKFQTITLATSLVLSLAVAPSVQANAKPKAFNGKTCTIVGTSKGDKLTGTPKADVICGLGGNDTISGAGGNDTIDGGAGNDKLSGGDGNDAIDGGAGNDLISGQKGNDALTGDNGNDSLNGGDGSDTLQGETGADVFIGGAGADTAVYSEKTKNLTLDIDNKADDGIANEKDNIKSDVENITGGKGNDTITGSSGVNVISGGAGNDTISGGAGNDQLNGDSGKDTISGGAGNDSLDGGKNTDTLNGESGANKCSGGSTWWLDNDLIDAVSCGDVNQPHFVSMTPLDGLVVSGINANPSSLRFRMIFQDDLSGFSDSGLDSVLKFHAIGHEFPEVSAWCEDETFVALDTTDDGRILKFQCDYILTWPRFSRHGKWEVSEYGASDLTGSQLWRNYSLFDEWPYPIVTVK